MIQLKNLGLAFMPFDLKLKFIAKNRRFLLSFIDKNSSYIHPKQKSQNPNSC